MPTTVARAAVGVPAPIGAADLLAGYDARDAGPSTGRPYLPERSRPQHHGDPGDDQVVGAYRAAADARRVANFDHGGRPNDW